MRHQVAEVNIFMGLETGHDPILEERRDHIVRVWNSKPFPDW